jgi:hypothetical protein
MADWRQIQARIRKAKNSPDPLGKLSQLYERTRDAMVAWELGALEEKTGRRDDATKWYTIAAGRFRRADLKKKAEDALARLGVALHTSIVEGIATEPAQTVEFGVNGNKDAALPLAFGEVQAETATPEPIAEPVSEPEQLAQPSVAAEPALVGKKKRRRGRRGRRGRRRKGATAAPALPGKAFVETAVLKPPVVTTDVRRAESFEPVSLIPEAVRRLPTEPPALLLPSERTAHGRAGDPALASRLAKLESMLRRLVASPLHRLDQLEEAPAGPGVFLLSDSDLISSYYIEACQTLRIGLGNLAHGGRGGKSSRGGYGQSEGRLKTKLAEHLGISEAKVGQYLKDHCVVRWIQLDDDAAHLAHFAIGVLRTPINVD